MGYKTMAETNAARIVKTDEAEIEPVRIRILPDGRMNRENAAKYVDRAAKTLAMWAMEGKGPPTHKAGGRVFYFKKDLDDFLGIEAAA